jgi:DTW domain-containing protein
MKVTLTDYHKKKAKLEHLKSLEEQKFRVLCYECLRPTKSCFCRSITPFNTNMDIRILMHPMESKEQVGTGRLANICLTNSKIHIGIDFKQDKEIQYLIDNPDSYCMILYPGEDSHNITATPLEKNLTHKKLIIFVIDATWPHAKLLMRENTQFHSLPRISFDPPGVSKFSIKHQPSKYCLCTIESLFHLVDGLNIHGHENLADEHNELMLTLEKLVKYQIECAENPELSSYRSKGHYKNPEERISSDKWKSRAICFDKKNYHKPS